MSHCDSTDVLMMINSGFLIIYFILIGIFTFRIFADFDVWFFVQIIWIHISNIFILIFNLWFGLQFVIYALCSIRVCILHGVRSDCTLHFLLSIVWIGYDVRSEEWKDFHQLKCCAFVGNNKIDKHLQMQITCVSFAAHIANFEVT